jgi:hypothetical protein
MPNDNPDIPICRLWRIWPFVIILWLYPRRSWDIRFAPTLRF